MFSRENVTDALRVWEFARIPYNLILAAVTAQAALANAHLCPTCDVLGRAQHYQVGDIFFWAVLANVVYSVAYIPDLLVQHSAFRSSRWIWRSAIWVIGTAFAGVIAAAIADVLFEPF